VGHTHETPRRRLSPQLLLWTTLVVAAVAIVSVVSLRGSEGINVSADQRLIIDRLESVLSHDTVAPQYDRVVNQFDARGYVAGIGDFSTEGGEVLEIVETYAARIGPNVLSRDYLPALQRLASEASADVDGLAGFPDAWRNASADRTFRQVQDDVLQSRYFTPARTIADRLGLSTPLGLAIIYDSLIQHGDTGHPDALPALIDRTNTTAGGTPNQVTERTWLAAFLDVRETTLADPTDPAHRDTWPYSLGRVQALADLLTDKRDALAPPIEVNPYGTRHVLDLRPIEQALPTATTAPSPSTSPSTSSAVPRVSRQPVVSSQPVVPPVWTTLTIQGTWVLKRGESVQTNRTRLAMLSDGDLVIIDENKAVRWRSGTAGHGDLVVFQSDGHLVVYDNSMVSWWQSGTPGHDGAVLVLQADGDVCIVHNGTVIWRSGTAH
jgi:chitosanase